MVLATTAVGLMALATRTACALAAVQSIPPQPGIARDGPRSHASPWPIYNGFDHQPTENELRALNEQDVAPAQAKVIDKLYDQLMSADKKMLGNHSILPWPRITPPSPTSWTATAVRGTRTDRDGSRPLLHALERFALPALLYYAPLAVGIRAMPMVVEPAVFVRFLQPPSHADFHLLVQQRRK
jgi:hypothetical protein